MTRAAWGLGLLGLAMAVKLWMVDGQVRRVQQTIEEVLEQAHVAWRLKEQGRNSIRSSTVSSAAGWARPTEMPCWVMPDWMERYRTCFQTGGCTVEEGMNRLMPPGRDGSQAHTIKQQVAMLIALREQGALKHVKPAWAEEASGETHLD